MENLKGDGKVEQELLEAFAGVTAKLRLRPLGQCPGRVELRRFASGGYRKLPKRRHQLLEHLADCDLCNQLLTEIRHKRVFRRAVFVRGSIALAAIFVAALVVATRLSMTRAKETTRIAVVDLRFSSPTRGESALRSQPAEIPRNATSLRVLLPVGGEGRYDVEILRSRADKGALVRTSASAIIAGEQVVLELSVNLSRVKSGDYLLALRHERAGWEYYALVLR